MSDSAIKQSYSQFGEDILVWKYFGNKTDGFFIEVGANDPENLSQTRLLESNGWQGILVEPQSVCCEQLRRVRPRAHVFQVACGAPEQRGKALFQLSQQSSKLTTPGTGGQSESQVEVRVMTLDDILEQTPHPRIDFLSIDVEGFELNVLRGFNLEKHQPRLMLIEDNLPDRLKVHYHVTNRGYRLVKRTGCNNWYVPRGEPFACSTAWERAKLFRKMYFGTAFRKLRMFLTGR